MPSLWMINKLFNDLKMWVKFKSFPGKLTQHKLLHFTPPPTSPKNIIWSIFVSLPITSAKTFKLGLHTFYYKSDVQLSFYLAFPKAFLIHAQGTSSSIWMAVLNICTHVLVSQIPVWSVFLATFQTSESI